MQSYVKLSENIFMITRKKQLKIIFNHPKLGDYFNNIRTQDGYYRLISEFLSIRWYISNSKNESSLYFFEDYSKLMISLTKDTTEIDFFIYRRFSLLNILKIIFFIPTRGIKDNFINTENMGSLLRLKEFIDEFHSNQEFRELAKFKILKNKTPYITKEKIDDLIDLENYIISQYTIKDHLLNRKD